MVRVTKSHIVAVEGPLGSTAERLENGDIVLRLRPIHVEDLMDTLANEVNPEVGVECMAVHQLLMAFGEFEIAE
jgi:hypothetical protein